MASFSLIDVVFSQTFLVFCVNQTKSSLPLHQITLQVFSMQVEGQIFYLCSKRMFLHQKRQQVQVISNFNQVRDDSIQPSGIKVQGKVFVFLNGAELPFQNHLLSAFSFRPFFLAYKVHPTLPVVLKPFVSLILADVFVEVTFFLFQLFYVYHFRLYWLWLLKKLILKQLSFMLMLQQQGHKGMFPNGQAFLSQC